MESVVRYYVAATGEDPFGDWFAGLDETAALKVQTALTRLQQGHRANVKAVGGGVAEYKIDFGPGYRIYFGQDGPALIILLAGGTKARQGRDIATALARWAQYKRNR